ncbi:MAG: hypothetical protein ACRCSN_14590 [Dermatophilaceae bacterium]
MTARYDYGENLETSAHRARQAHDQGVALPLPEYVLDITPRWGENADTLHLAANFYDELGRQRIDYSWVDVGGRMFLVNVGSWTYPDDDRYYDLNKATLIESFTFRLDGTSREWVNDKSQPTITTIDRDQVDLTAHFEPVPAFGDWARFGALRRKPRRDNGIDPA